MTATAPLRPPARQSRARAARGALRLLRERAWIGALAGVILLSLVFVLLGRWQYHRHEARSTRNALVEANYDAPPTSLEALLPDVARDPGRRLRADLEWRSVTLRGRYLADRTVLLRNRPRAAGNGYDVLVPLRTPGGPVLFVDRGWVPAGTSGAAAPDRVPQPPASEVSVVVRLRPPEPATARTAPPGQANRIAVRELARTLAAPDAAGVVGAYGVLVSESPPAPERPVAAERPDPGLGINLAYAVQWVAFALAAYVLLGVAMVREVRRRAGEELRPLRSPWRPRERDEYDEE